MSAYKSNYQYNQIKEVEICARPSGGWPLITLQNTMSCARKKLKSNV